MSLFLLFVWITFKLPDTFFFFFKKKSCYVKDYVCLLKCLGWYGPTNQQVLPKRFMRWQNWFDRSINISLNISKRTCCCLSSPPRQRNLAHINVFLMVVICREVEYDVQNKCTKTFYASAFPYIQMFCSCRVKIYMSLLFCGLNVLPHEMNFYLLCVYIYVLHMISKAAQMKVLPDFNVSKVF